MECKGEVESCEWGIDINTEGSCFSNGNICIINNIQSKTFQRRSENPCKTNIKERRPNRHALIPRNITSLPDLLTQSTFSTARLQLPVNLNIKRKTATISPSVFPTSLNSVLASNSSTIPIHVHISLLAI